MDDFELDWKLMQGGNYGSNEFNYGGRGNDDYTFESDWNAMTQGDGGYAPSETPRGGGYDFNYNLGGVQYDANNNYGGDFGKVSAGNVSWWEPAPSTYQSPFTATYGTGQNAGLYGGVQLGNATLGSGSGANITPGANGFGSGSFTTTPAVNSSNPDFGMMDEMGPGAPGSAGRNAYDESFRGSTLGRALSDTGDKVAEGAGYVKDKVGGALSAVDEYSRTNPMGTRLAMEGAGMLIGAYNQRNANKEARRIADIQEKDRQALRALQAEQLKMQRDMYERNNRQADQWNQQATQSANEARSLYNPQEMAIRGMAQQQMGTQNLINENERAMRNRGMSDAAIAAETRRARLGGTTGATTAFIKGLDTGRVAQQGALSSAKNLSQSYTSPGLTTSLGGGVDFTGAERMSTAGKDMTEQYKQLLNLYLDDPIYRSDQELRRRAQERSLNTKAG